MLLSRRDMPGDDSFEWRGQRFKMTRAFRDYDDYKNASDNIDPADIARIEKIMSEAKLPNSFSNKTNFFLAALQLKFPGYGFGSRIDEQKQPDGRTIHV